MRLIEHFMAGATARAAGFQSAGSGTLNLLTGAFSSGGGINSQLAFFYGADILANLMSGAIGTLVNQNICSSK